MIIRSIQKYTFAFLVVAYVLATVGVPVYYHYCGGQLAKVSYVVKANSCCGDDDDNGGCCSNDEAVVKCDVQATVKTVQPSPKRTVSQPVLSFIHFAFKLPVAKDSDDVLSFAQPPPLFQSQVVEVTVLRV